MDNISPEEKLLKLIRGKNKQGKTEDKKSPAVSSTAAVVGHSSKFSIYPRIQKYFPFLTINKIIFLIFIASCAYVITSFLYPIFSFKEIEFDKVTQEKIIDIEINLKPYDFYLQGFKNRQIFGSASTSDTQRQTIPLNSINADLIKDMNLIGIISGENSQAIIEDKKAQKTYYITKGQYVGEFQLEDIQEGKIILNYKGQKYELHL